MSAGTYIEMLDPIITRYKLTTDMYSYLQEYSLHPVDNTYNNKVSPKGHESDKKTT